MLSQELVNFIAPVPPPESTLQHQQALDVPEHPFTKDDHDGFLLTELELLHTSREEIRTQHLKAVQTRIITLLLFAGCIVSSANLVNSNQSATPDRVAAHGIIACLTAASGFIGYKRETRLLKLLRQS